MVYHPFSITKSFSPVSFFSAFRQFKGILSFKGFFSGLLISGMLSAWLTGPALALAKMDTQTINAALVYGMRSQKLGLSTILGPNWVEGDRGALLNVYSPFMILATKAAKAGFSSNPAKSDLDKARKRFGKEVAFYSDAKNRLQVKFAVSFYGDNPGFAKSYKAKIIGIGRGKEFEVKPSKTNLDEIADPVPNGQNGANYEAVNGYYFYFADLENLDELTLVLESPSGPPVQFRMKNARLY